MVRGEWCEAVKRWQWIVGAVGGFGRMYSCTRCVVRTLCVCVHACENKMNFYLVYNVGL